MTDKEKLVLLGHLTLTTRDIISGAIMGMRDTESALNTADSLLFSAIIVYNYNEKSENVNDKEKQNVSSYNK